MRCRPQRARCRDRSEQQGDDLGDGIDGVGNFLLIEDVEIVVAPGSQTMALAQQAGDLLLGNFHPVRAPNLDIDGAQVFVAGDAFHGGGVRDEMRSSWFCPPMPAPCFRAGQ